MVKASTGRVVALLVLAAVLQAALAALPDTMGDLLVYRLWARALVQEGLASAYWPPPEVAMGAPHYHPPIDYPPIVPYLLWLTGRGLAAVSPEALAGNDWLLDFLIRLPFCAASLLLALLVYLEARRTAPDQAVLLLGLLALNPALAFDTAYWGQADSFCALLMVAALVALVRGRPEWAGAAIAGAALVKPFAYPLAPLLLLETAKRFGLVRALRSAGAAALVVAVTLLPFARIGRLTDAMRTFVLQIDAMPYASVNAHNVWWLAGRGVPWTDASTRLLGPLTWTQLSLVVFGAFYLVTLFQLWRSSQARALYVAAASTALGFFMLSTHMHENHLFYALPLVALASLGSRRPWIRLVALTMTLLVNMALHDPFLAHVGRPYVPGPRLVVPPVSNVPEHLVAFLAAQGYPWMSEPIGGETSLIGLLATLVNAQANVLIFLAWVWRAHGGPSFDGAPYARAWPRPSVLVPALLAFIACTGVPFVLRALSFVR